MWPLVSRQVRLGVAAFIWNGVGLMLLTKGTLYAFQGARLVVVLSMVGGLLLGGVKGHFMLAKMARENSTRIIASGTREWIAAAFPPASWGIAFFFMVVGVAIRKSGLSGPLIGFVYVSAGIALMYGSAITWVALYRMDEVTES
jgi:hypothetical protein